MIFIAYNHDGLPVSIVSSKSEDLAKAFWHGGGIDAFSVKCLENPEHFTQLNDHPTGVIPILRTTEIPVASIDTRNSHKKILTIRPISD